MGVDGYVRRHANAFYAPVPDGIVIRNRHAQMKAARNVEQLGRQQGARSFLADDPSAAGCFQRICGDFPTTRTRMDRRLQARIDWLALERQDTKHTLVHSAKRLPGHETVQPLDAEREFTKG